MSTKILPALFAASSLFLVALPAMAEETAADMCTGLPTREESRCLDKASHLHRQTLRTKARAEHRTTVEEQQMNYNELRAQWQKSREALQGTMKETLQNATSSEERQAAVKAAREQRRSIMDQKKEEQKTFREEVRTERTQLLEEQKSTTRTANKNAILQREERRRLLQQTREDRLTFTPWWKNIDESTTSTTDESTDGTTEGSDAQE